MVSRRASWHMIHTVAEILPQTKTIKKIKTSLPVLWPSSGLSPQSFLEFVGGLDGAGTDFGGLDGAGTDLPEKSR